MKIDIVDEAAKSSGTSVAILSKVECEELVKKLKLQLGVDVGSVVPPWDSASAPDGVHRIDGWKLIPQFIGFSRCLMFLGGAQTVWRLRTGKDLLQILKECPAIEYYVCDEDASYLLCNNHHDFVIGWGLAQAWVSSLDRADKTPQGHQDRLVEKR